VLAALLVTGTASVALRTRRRRAVTGPEALIGSEGEMLEDATHEGWANVGGETWRVTAARPLARGQRVRVIARRGSLLEVAPLENHAQGA
jgi:membrane-bound serine protease (ClpP class)